MLLCSKANACAKGVFLLADAGRTRRDGEAGGGEGLTSGLRRSRRSRSCCPPQTKQALEFTAARACGNAELLALCGLSRCLASSARISPEFHQNYVQLYMFSCTSITSIYMFSCTCSAVHVQLFSCTSIMNNVQLYIYYIYCYVFWFYLYCICYGSLRCIVFSNVTMVWLGHLC